MLVGDHSSMPQGGVCNPDLGGSDPCYRFVGRTFSVTSDWRELAIGFDELRLMEDSNSPRRLDAHEIYTILFNFYGPGGNAFELAVDDLSFIDADSPICP